MTDRRALGLLTLLLLLISLPFVQRAYFVDDFYFVTMAKGILQHPARPYDFISDDAGIANVAWERGKQPRMVNPPLFHYFLAAVIASWGEESWKLRTASLIFPLISLFAVYYLGKRFVRNPLAAASLIAITPAFWLNTYALLIDSALLAFFLAALFCFIAGHEKKSGAWWLASGLLMGLTLLTKYTGFLIFPVILSWHWLHRDRCSWIGTCAAIGTCLAVFFLWGIWNIQTYGQMHFTATFTRGFHPAAPIGLVCLLLFVAGCYLAWRAGDRKSWTYGAWSCWVLSIALAIHSLTSSSSLAAWLQTVYLDKILAVSSFLGGCSVFVFFTPFLLWKRSQRLAAALFIGMGLLWMALSSRYGGFDLSQSVQLVFFIGSTVGFLLLSGKAIPPEADRSQLFLFTWLVLGLLELVIVMPWTAARYLLLLLPPAGWIFYGLLETTRLAWIRNAAWGTTLIVGGALAYVDSAQANVIRPLSQILESQAPAFQKLSPRPKNHWYYLADTFDGSQPYVMRWGWENVFPFQEFPKGSLFLRSTYRKSSWWNIPNPERFQQVMAWNFESRIPLRVMDVPASAGFYASCWGSLPYVVTRHPLERFVLFVVK